ncbi:MAG: ABC transporter ATP-binding protein [Candidatus Hydrogenedentota bacterium]
MAILELKHVEKGFRHRKRGDYTSILSDINLQIEEGEFLAVIGYSGSGKSTLISLLSGLTTPDAGVVLLDGREALQPGPDRGVVFQNYGLLPWLCVRRNIRLAVDSLHSEWTETERNEHAEKYMAMVNLTEAADKRPGQLSGGMRQRVALARTLAMEPRILLMDEPLSALDALTRATLQEEIVRIWERDRRTAVLITNDIDEAILMADRIIPLTAGPAASLGPEFRIDLPRPRDRKSISGDPAFRRLKMKITQYLLSPECRRMESAAAIAADKKRTAA